MSYLKRLFRNLLVVRILLLAVTLLAIGIFLLNQWLTGFLKIWAFLFGFSLTLPHLCIWAFLMWIGITFFNHIKEVGKKYARTPQGQDLPFIHKAIWFIVFAFFAVVIYIIVQSLILVWITLLSTDYGLVGVVMTYIIIGLILPFITGYLIERKQRPPIQAKNKIDSKLRILHDTPIQDESEDELGRDEFVNKIYDIINRYQGEESLVIGMNGPWGSGKTSVINLLRKKLQREENEFVVVDFNPWFFSDEAVLIREFFKAISADLNKRYSLPNFRNYIDGITRLLGSPTANVGPISLSFQLTTDRTAEEIFSLKDNLKEVLKTVDRKVVILIDDVDRLTQSELLLLFKLVRLCADFHKFIYLLSFNRSMIYHLLKRIEGPDPDAFLEKIINIDKPLPAVEKYRIDDYMMKGLESLLRDFEISLNKKEWDAVYHVYSEFISQKIQNLRHAKRLIFATTYSILEIRKEVRAEDIIGLEALRLFAYPVWEDISTRPEFYVCPWGTEFDILRLHLSLTDDKRVKQVRDHLNGVLNIVEADSQEFAKELLTFLFPTAGDVLEDRRSLYDELELQYEEEQRVAHPEYLKKYLQQKVPMDLISDEQIVKIIETLNNSREPDDSKHVLVKTFASYQGKNLLADFIQKLITLIARLNEIGDEVVLNAIYEFSNQFSPIGRNVFLKSELDRAQVLVFNIANKYRNSQKIQSILMDTVTKSKDLVFAAWLTDYCKPEKNQVIRDFKNINQTELKQTYRERFIREFVQTETDIFANINDIYKIKYILSGVENRRLITSYVLSLFSKQSQHIGKLLFGYVTSEDRGGREYWKFKYEDFKNSYIIEEIYNCVKKYGNKAYEEDREEWAVEEFIKIYEKEQRQLKNSEQKKSDSG